jgi:maltose O-acetyltransferase
VTVLPCVEIGSGSIVGAEAVVTRDIPPGMVAAGNPAKIICSVSDYLKKIKKQAEKKTIFDERYFIGNLNDSRREEVLDSVKDSVGFIL